MDSRTGNARKAQFGAYLSLARTRTHPRENENKLYVYVNASGISRILCALIVGSSTENSQLTEGKCGGKIAQDRVKNHMHKTKKTTDFEQHKPESRGQSRSQQMLCIRNGE